jgi:hypothetical protein
MWSGPIPESQEHLSKLLKKKGGCKVYSHLRV